MKQECCRRRRADGRSIFNAVSLAVGLLLVSLLLVSCGKPKPAAAPPGAPAPGQVAAPQPAPGQPAYTNGGGVTITTQPAQSLPGRVMQKGMSERCIENLRQLRMLIGIYQSENGSYPPALSGMSDAARISKCSVSRQEYVYDPNTGEVHCTFRGHEKY